MPTPNKCVVCGIDELEFSHNVIVDADSDDLFVTGRDFYFCEKCGSTQILNWKATKEVIGESEINPNGVDD